MRRPEVTTNEVTTNTSIYERFKSLLALLLVARVLPASLNLNSSQHILCLFLWKPPFFSFSQASLIFFLFVQIRDHNPSNGIQIPSNLAPFPFGWRAGLRRYDVLGRLD